MWHCIHAFCLSCLSKRKTSDCYFFFVFRTAKVMNPGGEEKAAGESKSTRSFTMNSLRGRS